LALLFDLKAMYGMAHFIHHEVSGGRFNKRLEVRAIASVGVRDFDARHDVGTDSAHQVSLEPILPLVIFGRHALISDLEAAPT
jgi:hypothetical protein